MFRFFQISIFLIFTATGFVCKAQNTPFPPPRQIQVFSTQALNFGEFYTGSSGGSIVISPDGIRSATGTVILMGGNYSQSVFVVELIPGRMVQIVLGPTVQLTRVGGGGSMEITIGPADKGSSFVTTGGHPFRNPVNVGATLLVGDNSANPPGEYQGSFSVTFIQE